MPLGLNYKILLQCGRYYNSDIGSCAGILGIALNSQISPKKSLSSTSTNEESARMQAYIYVFLSKTHTESKKIKALKEELIFQRTVASSQTFITPDLLHSEEGSKSSTFSLSLSPFPIPSLHHNSARLFPFRSPFPTQPWSPLCSPEAARQ